MERSEGLNRCGFTMVEIMVSISIIGLLAALLLPAVQSVRSQQRQVQCRNNLHQLILAAQNYESAFAVFPNRINDTYHCSADSQSSKWSTRSSYVVDSGSLSVALPSLDGFRSESSSRYRKARDVTDGLSTTVAYGERLLAPDYANSVGLDLTNFTKDWVRLSLLGLPSSSGNDTRDSVAEACRTRGRPDVPMNWVEIGDVEMNHALPPNSYSCYHTYYPPVSVSSQHPGGVNVAFAGGNIQMISDNIDLAIWRALGTRDGEETVGQF